MKKILLFSVIAILFVGCTPSKVKYGNQQQQNFDDFLAKKNEISYSQANDIQEKEFYKQFEKEIFEYIDSIKLLVNWKGNIRNIKTEVSGEQTAVIFEIYYKPEEHREITFECIHLVETTNLDSDYIYNQVKNISEYSSIYFDGLIRTKNNNQVYYNMRSPGNDRNIAYPNYYLWIVDIGIVDIQIPKRSDTLSKNLQNAVNYCYKINEPLKLHFLNKISKKESDKEFQSLLPEFENLKSHLTENEKSYIQRLNTCLTYNYLYGN